VYLWRDGKLAQLTQDHSYVQELITQGVISVDQARSHPQRNVVTQALGVTDPQALNVETMSGELAPGTQLLLCSDGLTEEVDDGTIARVLAHAECSAQECVDGLVAAALDGGGSDNVTVVLVRRH
jgi:protein phosphatase